jgi:hypothetical protein
MVSYGGKSGKIEGKTISGSSRPLIFLSARVFCGFGGLILVDSTRNWFYDFASSAREMELPKTPAAGALVSVANGRTLA